MYIFAILFLIGCVLNLITGDYVEAVGGFAIALIISVNAFMWGKSNDHSALRSSGALIAVTVLIIAFAFVAIKILEEIEVGSETYIQVADIQAKYPGLSGEIQNAMEDGEISIVEYHDIEEQYHLLSKERAIKAIMEGVKKNR